METCLLNFSWNTEIGILAFSVTHHPATILLSLKKQTNNSAGPNVLRGGGGREMVNGQDPTVVIKCLDSN